ncbi:hypothetical protein BH747_09655 [Enterococcus villorum]|uniref:Uncharacterized protein n=1 Tax=Enterococcus villorum TaxID=112904 RepID=A0A1V8YM59_9ENTE|nr:hypothetical protein BH747_09655 [Enterococcus villorum]OQO73701.1 hypothetical protein BH744_09155 [Enterococcus villorum]
MKKLRKNHCVQMKKQEKSFPQKVCRNPRINSRKTAIFFIHNMWKKWTNQCKTYVCLRNTYKIRKKQGICCG